jgi:hypothetical protein
MKSIAIAVALIALTAGTAHAFTYEGQSNFNADGTTRFTDPDDQLADGSKKAKSKSGFTMQFSGGPAGSTTGAGTQNGFVPSGNRAFYSPFAQQNNFSHLPNNPN